MKFTEEQARQELVGFYKDKEKDLDLSRTIEENVKNFFKVVNGNEELELSAFQEMVKPSIDTAVGLMRFEAKKVAVSKQLEIDEWKKKAEKVQTTPPPDPPTPPTLDEATAKRIAELESQVSIMTKKAQVGDKKKQLLDNVTKQVKNESWVNGMIGVMTIDENTDIEAESKKLVETYNKLVASNVIVSTPKTPTPPTEKQDSAYLDNLANMMGVNEKN